MNLLIYNKNHTTIPTADSHEKADMRNFRFQIKALCQFFYSRTEFLQQTMARLYRIPKRDLHKNFENYPALKALQLCAPSDVLDWLQALEFVKCQLYILH